MKLYNLYLLFTICGIVLSLLSCSKQESESVSDYETAKDSILINIQFPQINTIKLDKSIYNSPSSSQLVYENDKEKYYMLDQNIFAFDWHTGEISDTIPLTKCGEMGSMSGFLYHTKDSIFVYNSKDKYLYLIDRFGSVYNKWKRLSNSNIESHVSNIIAHNSTRMIFDGQNVYLSGFILGCLKEGKGRKIPVTEKLDIISGEFSPTMFYPNEYTLYNWGTFNMNLVSICNIPNGKLAYSFPILNNILIYNKENSQLDHINMTSRYDGKVKECELNISSLYNNNYNDINYYLKQTSYSEIIYDQYRNIFIRVANHKRTDWCGKGEYSKPISLIISDEYGNLISETPIIHTKRLLTSNMHVCKDGLAIAVKENDEDTINFAIFKLDYSYSDN